MAKVTYGSHAQEILHIRARVSATARQAGDGHQRRARGRRKPVQRAGSAGPGQAAPVHRAGSRRADARRIGTSLAGRSPKSRPKRQDVKLGPNRARRVSASGTTRTASPRSPSLAEVF